MYDLIIIGAGPAGLMAALTATKEGIRVLLVEKNSIPGKKLLATGNGHCNYTNKEMSMECYHGNQFAWDIIKEFDVKQTIDFLMSIGIFPYEKNGYFYPASGQANSVRDLLMYAINTTKLCDIWLNCKVDQIEKKNGRFLCKIQKSVYKTIRIKTKKNGKTKQKYSDADVEMLTVTGKTVIIAGGGMASPNLGSDGNMYSIAKKFNHRIIKPLPVLVGVTCKEYWFSELAGCRIPAKLEVYVNDEYMNTSSGELQIVADGISGIPVFQLSHLIAVSLDERKSVKVKITILPDIEEIIIQDYFKSTPKENYIGLIPEKLLNVLIRENNNETEFSRIFWCTCKEMHSFERAQVTRGGIDTKDINNQSLESRLCSGLFFAGEILDVDGICGGYNLQWAWSSGYIAGRSAAKNALYT